MSRDTYLIVSWHASQAVDKATHSGYQERAGIGGQKFVIVILKFSDWAKHSFLHDA